MTVASASFRVNFPEFADTTAYPDTQIELYLGLAELVIGSGIWRTQADYGTQLFIAHYLVLRREAMKASVRGGLPGIRTGAIASEGAGGVTVSYDTTSVAMQGAGFWNRSIYGTEFYQMRRMLGTGGLQL